MKKQKLRLKEEVKDFLGVLVFYLVIVVGVIVLNARCEYLNEQKRVATETTQEISK